MANLGPPGSDDLTVVVPQRRELVPALPDYGYASYGAGHEGGQDLSLAMLWRIAYEWRWLVVAAFGVGLIVAVLITLLTPLLYRATVSLELSPPKVEVLQDEDNISGRQGSTATDLNFLGTQLSLLESAALAERVSQDLNLANDAAVVGDGGDRAASAQAAANFVASGIETKLQPQSMIVDVSFVARDPQLAARVANGVADAYIKTNLERRYQSTSYARDFLDKQITATRRDLEQSERQLTAYAQQQRLISTGGGGAEGAGSDNDTNSLTGSTLVALNSALAETQARRIAAEQRYRQAVSGGSTSETSGNAAGLRSEIARLQAEYQQKLQTFKPDYPDMVALRAQIDALRQSASRETSGAQGDRLNTLRQDFQAVRAEEGRLRAQVAGLSGQVLDQRGKRIRYNILQRDVDTNRELYNALLQRYKQIGVAGGIGAAVASVVDPAQVPGGAFSPNLYLNLLIGGLAGLIIGMLAALALEFINDTIKSPDDVRNKLRLPFLGGVPPAQSDKPVDELRDSNSALSEAYLSLATAMQFATEGGAPKTLLITSTRPAEGKSTSAWGLAQSFARLGKSVLMIDADMRRPAFVTGKEDVGLSHILTNTASLSEHVLKTDVVNLWMMPAGTLPPSPPELLAAPRFASLLAEAASTFDMVIVDGPPILGLADSPLLSTATRATLMVVEAGRTRTRAAVEAQNRLRTAGGHMIGAVLVRYQAQSAYGYGYGYGGKQDQYRYVADENKKRRILLTVQDED